MVECAKVDISLVGIAIGGFDGGCLFCLLLLVCFGCYIVVIFKLCKAI